MPVPAIIPTPKVFVSLAVVVPVIESVPNETLNSWGIVLVPASVEIPLLILTD